MKTWYVGIYARVSTTKDEQKDSIQAQIQSLKEWIRTNNEKGIEQYKLVQIFQDYGISGATFNRDEFDEMKKCIEQGKINMVLTRDLSRFGRNYVQAGYYLEDYFKINCIRFVSVLDNVDTIHEINDIIPFKNVLNEMYIKDCSRKSRDGLKQRMTRGSYIGSKAPYGYVKEIVEDKGQKTIRLVPAEDETTETVKEIFQMYLDGWGYSRIASYLNDKKIPPPAALIDFPLSKGYLWNVNGVKSILTNPKYGGIMVQGQYKKISYKLKKTIKLPPENWIYSGEFQGIVSKDIYMKVQELRVARSGIGQNESRSSQLFSGKILCGDCGSAMGYQKKYQGYRCVNAQKGKQCTAHSIKEDFLLEQIIEDIQACCKNLETGRLWSLKNLALNTKKEDIQKNLADIEEQYKKAEGKLKKLYCDRLEGHISKELFLTFSNEIQDKQISLLKKKDQLDKQCTEINRRMKQWQEGPFRQIERILCLENISSEIVDRLVEVIIVHEYKNRGEKVVNLHYRFRDADLNDKNAILFSKD